MNIEVTLPSNANNLHLKSLTIQSEDCSGIVHGISGVLMCTIQDFVNTKEIKSKNQIYDLIDELTSQPIDKLSFGYGLTGLAWIISISKKYNLFENIDAWLEEYNVVLEKYYYYMLYQKNLDYFKGASGILFYFLEAGYLRKKLVDAFLDCLQERENGIPPSYYIERNRSHINLGTPHGLNGVILILLRLKEHGEEATDTLIINLLDEFLSYKKDGYPYHFPGAVSEKEESGTGLAWCYGDLMASYALLKAGLLLHKEKYTNLAQPILTDLIHREDCSDKLVLCHGYTSTSMVLRKMHELTNNKSLLNASTKWQKLAIETFNYKYKMYQEKGLYSSYFENRSLFYGFSGILLSFGKIFYRECERSLLL